MGVQEKSAAKLQRLPRESQQEYMRLLEENGKWSAEIAGQQAQLESLNARITEAEDQLSMDRSREEGQSLESQLMRLQSQLKEVQEEARSARADPAELRDKLFRKTKEDNERLVRLQQVHREVLEDSETKRKVGFLLLPARSLSSPWKHVLVDVSGRCGSGHGPGRAP
jgi:peptidoglycan hydrolase CwlO-like protein